MKIPLLLSGLWKNWAVGYNLILPPGKEFGKLSIGDRVRIGTDAWTVSSCGSYGIRGGRGMSFGIFRQMDCADQHAIIHAIIRIENDAAYLLRSKEWDRVEDEIGASICPWELEDPECEDVFFEKKTYRRERVDQILFPGESSDRKCCVYRSGNHLLFMEYFVSGGIPTSNGRRAFSACELTIVSPP